MSHGSRLSVIDIEDPVRPRVVGSVETPCRGEAVAIRGRYAYVAGTVCGLQVIDVGDPFQPQIVGSVPTPSPAGGVAVMSGGRVFVSVREIDKPRVVEIGPGQGAITVPLLDRVGTLHVVEIDRDLCSELRHRCAGHGVPVIHCADALRFDFAALAPAGSRLRLVGNLPYNISTPLIFHLLGQREHIEDMHFMLQREVVDRMAALPGTKQYGRLTVMLAAGCRVEPLFSVGPGAFRPPPRVRSSVVRLTMALIRSVSPRRSGSASSRRAMTPATCGAAMLVPEAVR